MKKTAIIRSLSFILVTLLFAATVFFVSGCANSTTFPKPEEDSEVTTLGQGDKFFYFSVIDKDNNRTEFLIYSDAETVADALLSVNLIEGNPGDYGLYVKKVNGITADYNVDGTYWAFYAGDTLSPTGVDATKIVNSSRYAFRVE